MTDNKPTNKKRRQLMTFMGASTVAIPVAALIGSMPSHADDAPMVDEASAAAENWEYVVMSADESKNCANCALYQGEPGAKGGACPLFPGSQVHATAWCKAYAPKPS